MGKILNTSKFIEESIKIHGNIYEYSQVEYKNCKTKVKIKCLICNTEFLQIPSGHISGKGCKKCSIKRITSTKEEFIQKSIEVHINKYNYDQVQYKNDSSKVKIRCLLCNSYFHQTPNHHLQGRGCRKCGSKNSANKNRSTKNEFINNAIKIHNVSKYNYSFVDYKDAHTKVKIECLNCNVIFNQSPSNHLMGNGCPKCRESKGERDITNWLNINKIQYSSQKTFKSCLSSNNRQLIFDFHLPTYNILIEYDGRQHFEPIKKFGGIDEFQLIQLRDLIKTEFALNNRIILIRIPYTERKNVCRILENSLKF